MSKTISERAFTKALSKLPLPGGSQLRFLKSHATAKGRAATMRVLAKEVGYKDWNGMNLRYGILARNIGNAAGLQNANISLLVEFVPPMGRSKEENLSNSEWILIMREPFAKALKSVGWI